MKRLALTLIVAVAATTTIPGSTASASDQSHRRSRSSVGHTIGHLIFGGHSYGSSYGGHSSYRSPSQYGHSS